MEIFLRHLNEEKQYHVYIMLSFMWKEEGLGKYGVKGRHFQFHILNFVWSEFLSTYICMYFPLNIFFNAHPLESSILSARINSKEITNSERYKKLFLQALYVMIKTQKP